MTTIVKHRRTGNEYILLGINGEANKANPSRFISELFNQEKSEVSCSATVCDVQGNIFLAYIDDLLVVEIDGLRPGEILPEANYEADYETVEADSRSPKVEVVQSPDSEFEESDRKPTPLQTPIPGNAVDSLDAPNQDQARDDEDWI
jgi:hypothetical protein